MGFTITPQAPKVSKATVATVAVPDDVAADLLGLWEFIAGNADKKIDPHPNFTGHALFENADEIAPFVAQATSWARAHTALNADGTEGPLTFRKLPPGKDAKDTEIRFSLSAVPTKAEQADRDAKKAKRDAKKAEAKANT